VLQQLLRSDSLVTSHGVPPASAFTISRRDGLEIEGLAKTDTVVWAAAMSLASQLLVVEPSSEATVRSSSRWAIRRDTAPRTARLGMSSWVALVERELGVELRDPQRGVDQVDGAGADRERRQRLSERMVAQETHISDGG
jgi:hypothetical protein